MSLPSVLCRKRAVRQTYDPSLPLFSIHIPKCAGTSFLAALKSWFGDGLLTHYPDEKRGSDPTKHVLAQAHPPVCVHGHFNYKRGNGVEAFYPKASQRITIIREPFQVHLSNYFFGKKLLRRNALYRNGLKKDINSEYSNIHSYLSLCRASFIPDFFPNNLTVQNCSDYLESNYLYVGLFEELDKSCCWLSRKFGFPHERLQHVNPAHRDEKIPRGAFERFREENPLAYAIYNYARQNYVA